MSTQAEKQTISGLIDSIPILYKVLTPIGLMFFWFHSNVPTMSMVVENRAQIETMKSNFASQTQYKEQQKQIDELREDMAKAFKTLSEQIEKSNIEMRTFSDRNRERMESQYQSLKEFTKSSFDEQKDFLKTLANQRRGRN